MRLEPIPDLHPAHDLTSRLAALARQLREVGPDDHGAVGAALQPLLARARDPDLRAPVREVLVAIVETARRRRFLERLRPEQVEPWLGVLLPVLHAADYAVADVLRGPDEPALRVLAPAEVLGRNELRRRTRALAAGFAALLDGAEGGRVALLSDNRLEVALCDLACLAHGIVDVPVPANAAPDQVQYVLRHSGARVLVAADAAQLAKVLPARASLPRLETIVCLDRTAAERHGLWGLDEVLARGASVGADELDGRAARVRADDLATVMYTSGTTGTPKGIRFTHHNLVAKRLCRSFALPSLGEGDVFLAYLPLFHTFGRWFELLGALWAGAQYVFARAPALPTLLEDFAAVHPTAFISVPQKWLELHERAVREVGEEDPDRVAERLRGLTGGRLAHGLSAAGYLDPRVFRAFQRAGVELCSGYGMTEATGGVTMTPPGEYVEGSIGKPLPGVEARIAEDGELKLRGPYLMQGYEAPPDGDPGLDAEGFFATGDLVTVDSQGHYRLAGRKKEIFKNLRGQTIAPQRVENLFRDFDAVAQAFLAGDGREFNTLLIWPNFAAQPALARKSPEALRTLLGSLVATANRFLAPFERVVDFAILDRPLDEVHGEVTAKGTWRRDAVERGWRHLIDPMYRRADARLEVGGRELRIPNWLLRELGALREDLRLADGILEARGRRLRVEPEGAGLRLGDYVYEGRHGLDLGVIAGTPSLAFGNEGLREMLGDAAFVALLARHRSPDREISVGARGAPAPSRRRIHALLPRVEAHEPSVESLHAAAVLVRGHRLGARVAIEHLERGLALGGEAAEACRAILRLAADAADRATRARALRALLPAEAPERIVETFGHFLARGGPGFPGDRDLARLADRGLSDDRVEALLSGVRERAQQSDRRADREERRRLVGAMRLLTAYAGAHPAWYSRLRSKLARLALDPDDEIAARAGEELDRLNLVFRAWLGPNLRLAVDPDSGREYGWDEVVAFAPGVPEAHRHLLRRALRETSLVREATFLFGRGTLLSLADLPPGGVRVEPAPAASGEAAYRLGIAPRSADRFEATLHVAEAVPVLGLREEIRWLLTAGAPPPLVAAFGGYYPEHGLYTTERTGADTVERLVDRLAASGAEARLRALWPFLAWTAFGLHVGLWERGGGRVALARPSPANVVAPSHDYQVGARLVSLWGREACAGVADLLARFEEGFVRPIEARHPGLAGLASRGLLWGALVEALGEERGVAELDRVGSGEAARHAERIRAEGATPREVHFAGERYRRWLAVNPDPTVGARAQMLRELWATYRLDEVERRWPDARVRFFRRTVFAAARPELAAGLDRLARLARERPARAQEVAERVAALRATTRPTADEDYFLARLAWRHLEPGQDTALIEVPHAGRTTADVVVALEDADGHRFWIRGPVSPREVARLLQLFDEASLPVSFGAEHEHLLAVDERGALLGGVFFRMVGPDRARMEKIGVARAQRSKGVSDGLMQELKRRLRERGVRHLETGFFHPESLRRFGFHTRRSSGGLFQDLEPEAVPLE